jgi:hypothetical protein
MILPQNLTEPSTLEGVRHPHLSLSDNQSPNDSLIRERGGRYKHQDELFSLATTQG